jgi:acyl carrier protein
LSDVYEKVKEIIEEHLNVDPERITESAAIVEDLGADSFDCVEIIMAFEEEFNLEIPDDDAEKIETIGEAVEYIEQHRA